MTARVFLLLACGAMRAAAQGSVTDSALARVDRLAREGSTGMARALADSLVRVTADGTAQHGEALYWRASLAEDANAARRDYLQLVLDYPRSARVEDAQLRLAQIEFARGDRAAARRYLERLRLEHPGGRSEAQASYWLGRVLFDQGEQAGACAALAEAATAARQGDVELKNQIAYYSRPCEAIARAAARTDSVARADSAMAAAALAAGRGRGTRADSAERTRGGTATPSRARTDTARSTSPGPAPRVTWSVQVAAYKSKDEATALADKLIRRGYDARVTGAAPYRVRVGHMATRAGAAALAEKIRASKMAAIVVEAERP